eukprot:PhF_6_TR25516/c0_g1_i1/m.35642
MDEVDLILHPLKSELNFPIGPKEQIDFAPMRWTLPMYLLDAIFYYTTGKISAETTEASRIVLSKLVDVIDNGLRIKVMQKVPHLILLDTGFYHRELKPLLAEWVYGWMEQHNFIGLEREEVLLYIREGAHKSPAVKEKVERTLSGRCKQMLNLSHDWLRSYLPHVLSKINRVSFGIMTASDKKKALEECPTMPISRFMLAIPFIGKDVPSDSSEFAHPDIIIGLTILAYRYEGMRMTDFKELLGNLHQNAEKEPGEWSQRKSNLRYETWVQQGGGEIRGRPVYRSMTMILESDGFDRAETSAEISTGSVKVPSLRLLHQSSREHVLKLFNLFRRMPQVVHFYLGEFVFPTFMRHQVTKLSASGQELGGDALFPSRIGFSGTPSNLLPIEMGTCQYEKGTDGFLID